MRIDLVEDLESLVRLLNDGGWDADVRVVQEAISALEASQWVKCSERLPEPYTEVMIWPPANDRILTAQLTKTKSNPEPHWLYSEYVHSYGYDDYECNPTFWQPLPAPPRVEQGEL